jgi:hypothetical protein
MSFAVRIRGRLTIEERETFRREASDPTTPPERLVDISRLRALDCFAHIGPSLVANPNTPPKTLLELAPEYPEAFATNPAAPLLPLERPEILSGLSLSGQLRLLRRPELPLIFVVAWMRSPHPSVADAAHWHIRVAGEADPDRDSWEDEAFDALPVLASGHRLSDRTREELRRCVGELWRIELAPAFIARRLGLTTSPPDPLRLPSLHPDYRDRQQAEILRHRAVKYAEMPLPRFCLLATAPLPENELVEAVDSLRWPDRLAVALNPCLPTAYRDILTGDGHRLVHAAARAYRVINSRTSDTAVPQATISGD